MTNSPREPEAPTGAIDCLRNEVTATALRQALRRYARLLGADAGLADDLVQESFRIALERPGFDARVPGATFAFLRTTARHLWLRRHGSRLPPQQLADADAVWDARCADGGDDYLDALRACLDGIPDRSRSLLMAVYGDARQRGAGRAFGLGANGQKSALRRIRAFLHDCIARRLRAHEP